AGLRQQDSPTEPVRKRRRRTTLAPDRLRSVMMLVTARKFPGTAAWHTCPGLDFALAGDDLVVEVRRQHTDDRVQRLDTGAPARAHAPRLALAELLDVGFAVHSHHVHHVRWIAGNFPRVVGTVPLMAAVLMAA